jgi:hypothetical protein
MMAGRGRQPKAPDARRNAHPPARGEWQATSSPGWQHGPVPEPPDDLGDESRSAWRAWFAGVAAAHWTPGDLPSLRIVIRLYDAVLDGASAHAGELRLWMDTYGITPKGQQDRRWVGAAQAEAPRNDAGLEPYRHLLDDRRSAKDRFRVVVDGPDGPGEAS